MKKWCNGCKLDLPISKFNKKGTYSNGKIKYQPYCRNCNKIHSKAYYERNKKSHIERITRNRKIHKDMVHSYIIGYLNEHPCVDCGMNDIRTLEFDHVRGIKLESISKLREHSLTKLKKEISKCDVRCANCHRIKTSNDFEHFKSVYVNAL